MIINKAVYLTRNLSISNKCAVLFLKINVEIKINVKKELKDFI